MYNSIGKIATKRIDNLIGLKMGMIEQSYKTLVSKNVLILKNDLMYNKTPITQVERRFMSEIEGLKVISIEQSHKVRRMYLKNVKKIKPHKKVDIKLKLIKKSNIKMEV